MRYILTFLFVIFLAQSVHGEFPLPGSRGRPGARGQEIVTRLLGGTASSSNLNLFANTVAFNQANTGRIILHGRTLWQDDFAKNSTALLSLLEYTGTITGPGIANLQFTGFNFKPTIAWDTAQSFTTIPAFWAQPIFAPTAAVADSGLVTLAGFISQPRYSPSVTSGTGSTGLIAGYYTDFVATRAGSTTLTIAEVSGFSASSVLGIGFTANTGTTITKATGLHVGNGSGSGTITELVGIELETLTKGGTNLSLRSSGASVQMRHAGPARFGSSSAGPTGGSILHVDGGLTYKRTTFSNTTYTILTTDLYVAQIGTMSASRAVTLPSAATAAAGKVYIIADESGTVTGTFTIVITRAGSDTINGATTRVISTAFGFVQLISDGTSKWTVMG